jgi:hypothetical protein
VCFVPGQVVKRHGADASFGRQGVPCKGAIEIQSQGLRLRLRSRQEALLDARNTQNAGFFLNFPKNACSAFLLNNGHSGEKAASEILIPDKTAELREQGLKSQPCLTRIMWRPEFVCSISDLKRLELFFASRHLVSRLSCIPGAVNL